MVLFILLDLKNENHLLLFNINFFLFYFILFLHNLFYIYMFYLNVFIAFTKGCFHNKLYIVYSITEKV